MGTPRPGSQRLAARLKTLRGGLSQQDSAYRAGINASTWQNLELCKTRAQPVTLQRIAEGFGIDFDELWGYVDDRPLDERFTDDEIERLAARLAPLIAGRIVKTLNEAPPPPPMITGR